MYKKILKKIFNIFKVPSKQIKKFQWLLVARGENR